MKRFLLDRNVVSKLRKPRPHGAVLAWIKQQREEQLFLSAVTLGEIQAGIDRTRRHDRSEANELEEWLDLLAESWQILPMDAGCFREWGRLRDQKTDQLLEDGMIAATARVHGLVIATRNERDFKQLGVEIINPFQIR
jgi:predicted nucleic acid-binding protein